MSVGVTDNMNRQASTKQIECSRLMIVLIKPSKYDDEGYVIRHFRGILPSNTLACLCSLTEDLNRSRVLGDNLEISIKILDDTVQKIPVDKIIRSSFPVAGQSSRLSASNPTSFLAPPILPGVFGLEGCRS